MTNNGVEYVLSLKDLFTSKIRGATQETEKLNGAVGKAQNSITGLGAGLKTAFAALGGAYIVSEITKTTAAMEGLNNQLAFASGSTEKGAQDMEWLRERTQYLGLDLETAANSFAKFSGAARGTALEGEGVKNIFDGVAKAATVMHLSAEEADGTFRALQQMLSKGKVSAEELNGQLGERLPGALGVASRAMNMTQADLMKMMQKGELMSEDFLPKFGEQLKKEFGDASETARESLTANLNRMNNAFLQIKVTLGKAITPVVLAIVKAIDWIKEKWDLIVYAVQPFIDEVIYLKNELVGVGQSFNWANVLKNIFGALRIVLILIQPLLHIAIKGFSIMLEVIIGVVNGILNMINSLGRLFGMKEFKMLGDTKKAVSPAGLAMSPMAAGGSKAAAAPTTSAGGTSTSAVESKGVQNFNISINKLVEKLDISTTTIKESGAAIKEEVAKALLEAVNDFQMLATK